MSSFDQISAKKTTYSTLSRDIQSPMKTGVCLAFGPSDGKLRDNFRAYLQLRAILYLENVRRGGKVAAAREAAESFGVSLRSVYTWREQFRKLGILGLLRRRRRDCGRSRSLSADIIEAIRQRQGEMRGRGNLSSVWRSLGKPATFESFRYWVRLIQKSKLVELPPDRTGGSRAASF